MRKRSKNLPENFSRAKPYAAKEATNIARIVEDTATMALLRI